MTICYFGDYHMNGRTQVLRLAIEKAGIKIIDCHSQATGIRFFIELIRKHHALRGTYDVLFIGNSGPSYFMPLLAQFITRKPVVWEPLFSIYDNFIFDRKYASRYSIKALGYFLMDLVGSHSADKIILDTERNCKYFEDTFKARRGRCAVVRTGADTSIFYPRTEMPDPKKFEIEFHGKYIPIHGTEVMVRAAKLLEDDPDIHFTMIGKGQTYAETVKLAETLGVTNMDFLPFMPQAELVEYVSRAHVTIGLLGDVPRIEMAIPGKLYECAAMERVSVNADTVALREVFTPGKDVIGVRQGDPVSFAEAIRKVKAEGSALTMGKEARVTFEREVSLESLGRAAKNILESVIEP